MKREAIFLLQNWRLTGSQIPSKEYNDMCCAKKIYKRAIRQAKRQFKDYRAAYVAELLDNKDVDFRIK